MDVSGLLGGTFPPNTKLVWSLAREIQRLQAMLDARTAGMRKICDAKRAPVLLVVEPDGEVNAFGHRAEVEVVHVPQGDWSGVARTMVEQWCERQLPPRFRELHWPRQWLNRADYRLCPSLESLMDRWHERALWRELTALQERMKR